MKVNERLPKNVPTTDDHSCHLAFRNGSKNSGWVAKIQNHDTTLLKEESDRRPQRRSVSATHQKRRSLATPLVPHPRRHCRRRRRWECRRGERSIIRRRRAFEGGDSWTRVVVVVVVFSPAPAIKRSARPDPVVAGRRRR